MTEPVESKPQVVEPEEEITPASGHAKMPWWLLLIWIANIIFFIVYFVRLGLPDLEQWLNRT